VLLIGNPNTGKTTLFNALTGLRHRVGNYAGVTVETKSGDAVIGGRPVRVTDVPGTYSLSPRSPDEMLAVELLLGLRPGEPRPDVILAIVDASNLERNLFLTTQLLELGPPVVLALNMSDVAESRGIRIDAEKLSRTLGVRAVPIQAANRIGFAELSVALIEAVEVGPSEPPPGAQDPQGREVELGSPPRQHPKGLENGSAGPTFPASFRESVTRVQTRLDSGAGDPVARFLVERAILDAGGQCEKALAERFGAGLTADLARERAALAEAGCMVPAVEAGVRYRWIAERVRPCVDRPAERVETGTDRIDRWVLHPVFGLVLFLGLMAVMFQSLFSWAGLLSDPIDHGFGVVREWLKGRLPEGAIAGLLTDGVIAGVGNVLVFVPQIAILFAILAVLEDCGYMARAAFLMDRLMSRCELSGKSFIPLLSSFACAIPGIMAARTIENRRDRLATILVAPLMSCSARLPLYTVLIAAFIPEIPLLALPIRLPGSDGPLTILGAPGLTMLGLYLLGLVLAPLVAWILKGTLLKGETPVFIMELPAYKFPSLLTVSFRVADAAWAFVRRAGTLILATTVIIWVLNHYPGSPEADARYAEPIAAAQKLEESHPEKSPEREAAAESRRKLENELAAARQEASFLGRAGHAVEPIFRPLGWDWRISVAALASFPAREVVVSTMGILFAVGEADEESPMLREALKSAKRSDGTPLFTVPVALSLMVFFALCAQCVSTLAIIRREAGHWGWAAFTFAYMTGLAWVGGFLTYRIALAFAG
jgi:ferrous iron transport protein B